jgi:hypothetical protein
VIEVTDEGLLLDFVDWTAPMMALASQLWDLPRRPGAEGPSLHEYGVDRLARMRNGRLAIEVLHGHVCDLDFRPDDDEVVQLGQALLRVDRELAALRRDRVRRRCAHRERSRDQPTPRYGFRRGPRAGG